MESKIEIGLVLGWGVMFAFVAVIILFSQYYRGKILKSEKEKQIETTADEIESFFIVKSILRTLVDSNRITYRDAQSYFAILLDDNNRKAICRIYLNSNKKSIGIFDSAKKETKNEIFTLDDIYTFSDQLKATVETYLALNS